jgi:hypothetical protein
LFATSPYRVTAAGPAAPLRQGEILATVVRTRVDPTTIGTGELAYGEVEHRLAVILTQDCDLEQDHKVRFPGPQEESDKLIPSVLFGELMTAGELFAPTIARHGRKSKVWDRIQQNNDPRYHFLQKVEPGCDRLNEGLPELAIDFKRFFTVPTDEVYRRIEIGEARRRCLLTSPYLEHLSCRFAFYLSRVGLPTDHFSE